MPRVFEPVDVRIEQHHVPFHGHRDGFGTLEKMTLSRSSAPVSAFTIRLGTGHPSGRGSSSMGRATATMTTLAGGA